MVGVIVGLRVGEIVGFGVGTIEGEIVGVDVGVHVGVSVGGESEHKDVLKVEHHCPAVQISLLTPSMHIQSDPLTAHWPVLSAHAWIPAQLL